MSNHLTPLEVWNEFWETTGRHLKPVPNELWKANQTAQGGVKRVTKRGEVNTVTLGAGRVKRLIEKYAPGRYEYHEGEPYFTRKGQ
jgi:hypothetical protein